MGIWTNNGCMVFGSLQFQVLLQYFIHQTYLKAINPYYAIRVSSEVMDL